MSYGWFLITIIAVVVAIFRKDLRREMIWAGFLALPILFIKPLIQGDFTDIAVKNGGFLVFVIERALLSFSFGALSSSIYETFFHKRITPQKHPHRKKMIWLLSGPIIFIILVTVFEQSLVLALLLSLMLDIMLVLFIRKDLIWDLLFSAFSMGVLYFLIFLVVYRGFPGEIQNLWFTNSLIGITLFSVPIEELLVIMFWGALWGPIYVVIKDLKEK